jgi:hypothetical protein
VAHDELLRLEAFQRQESGTWRERFYLLTYLGSQLGFKDEATARRSVTTLDQWYRHFARGGDRAGQRHVLYIALVMFDRARWMGKAAEADLFRQWLVAHLNVAASADRQDMVSPAPMSD